MLNVQSFEIQRREATSQVRIRLNLIIVIVDVGSVSVGTVVTGAGGGVLIIVMLPSLVVGASVVHPVGQVSLQPLGRDGEGNSRQETEAETRNMETTQTQSTAIIPQTTDSLHSCNTQIQTKHLCQIKTSAHRRQQMLQSQMLQTFSQPRIFCS